MKFLFVAAEKPAGYYNENSADSIQKYRKISLPVIAQRRSVITGLKRVATIIPGIRPA